MLDRLLPFLGKGISRLKRANVTVTDHLDFSLLSEDASVRIALAGSGGLEEDNDESGGDQREKERRQHSSGSKQKKSGPPAANVGSLRGKPRPKKGGGS